MDTTTVVTVILGSSFLSAIFTWILNFLIKQREVKSHNRFIGLTLAKNLESYSWNCAEAVANYSLHSESDGSAGEDNVTIPEIFELPDENYRHFDVDILDEVYAFPLKVKSAERQAKFSFEVEGIEEAIWSTFEECIKLGMAANEIAKLIRKKYSLSTRPVAFGVTTLDDYYRKKTKS